MCDQIFIVGPARSGTSIMMRAVRAACPDHKSYDEGHFLDLICALETATNEFFDRTKSHYRTFDNMTVSKISREALLRRFAETLISENAQAVGSEQMIDKTHGALMVRALPAIASVLPKSRFIMMKRRLNEFLRSAEVKFPNWTREERVGHWVSTMEAWLEVGPRLGDQCLEVEHLDIVQRPRDVGSAMADHLGLPREQAFVLADFFQGTSIEKTPGGTYEPTSLDEIGLTPEAVTNLLGATLDLSTRLGYGPGKHYYALCEPEPAATVRRVVRDTRPK